MHLAFSVLGALLTASVSLAIGLLVFRRLGIALNRMEHELLAGVTGASLLSLAVFLLCALKLAYMPVFALFAPLPFFIRRPASAGAPPALPKAWKWLFAVALAFYAAIYLANSLAPEMSPDGMAYHLGLVSRYFGAHGFEPIATSMYADLSQGMEMLFLFAFAFGRHSAAATVHCLFLLTLPSLILSYARRAGHPKAGVCAAMLVFLSPVAGVDGVSAYNDVALATTAFALFYLLEIWRDTPDGDRLLIPIGLLAGFCFAIKYTGFVAPIYALAVVRRRVTRPSVIAAAAMALPWLGKNWLLTGNPLAPFFNRTFPNPFVHVSFEDSYRAYFHTYNLPSLKPLFTMVTVTGQLGGQIGPLFLAAPLAILSVRSRAGRHCLLAAIFFLLPYPQNIGARFLIPALPFVALGIALALEAVPPIQAMLVAAALVLAWPRVIDRYRAPVGGWQIATVPWQAALGAIPAETWLARSPDYRLAEAINRSVPVNQTVWSSTAVAEAYTKPRVLVNYYSAEGQLIEDMLLTPIREDSQPLWDLRFTFPPRLVQHLRIVQDAASPTDIWSVGEARFYHGDDEIDPVRADAKPFPWDIGLAFDHNPVTRWKSWESIHPGMHIDADFAVPVQLDRVDLFCSHDQWKIDVRLDGIPAKREKLDLKPMGDLRRLAMRTIRSRGVGYLTIGGDYVAAADMRGDPGRWGLRLAAASDDNRIYQIQ